MIISFAHDFMSFHFKFRNNPVAFTFKINFQNPFLK